MSAMPLSFSYAADPPSDVFDNYISKYYNHYLVESAKKKEGHNFRFLQHSNGIIVLCIDPSHVLFNELRGKHPNGTDEKVTIQAIAFGSQRRQNQNQEGEKDLSAIQVKGKRKKNALGCQVDTCLCTVTLSTGTVYVMPACINGFVLELNARLVEQPELLVTAPLNEGFLAVINPSAKTTLSSFKKIHTATSGETLLEEGE